MLDSVIIQRCQHGRKSFPAGTPMSLYKISASDPKITALNGFEICRAWKHVHHRFFNNQVWIGFSDLTSTSGCSGLPILGEGDESG